MMLLIRVCDITNGINSGTVIEIKRTKLPKLKLITLIIYIGSCNMSSGIEHIFLWLPNIFLIKIVKSGKKFIDDVL